jgi:DNA-binding GntR family transcriptional regulator
VLRAIINLDLAPGERLVEGRLAGQLGVSRLPVREALHRLERERLVIFRPRRSAIVAPLTAHDADEIYTLRITLEGLAARLAAENASGAQIRAMEATVANAAPEIAAGRLQALFESGAALHAQIVVASGNRMLAAVLETIGHHVARLRAVQLRSAHFPIVEYAQRSHMEIYQAIARRDGALAQQLMEEHVTRARDRIVPLLPTPSADADEIPRLVAYPFVLPAPATTAGDGHDRSRSDALAEG